MSIDSVKSRNEIARTDVPYSHTLVKRACCDIFATRRDSYCGYTIFNDEVEDFPIVLNVPDADCVVATTGGNVAAIASEI